jgi:hypothetical protein
LFNGTGTSLVRLTLKPATHDLPCGYVRIRAVPRHDAAIILPASLSRGKP